MQEHASVSYAPMLVAKDTQARTALEPALSGRGRQVQRARHTPGGGGGGGGRRSEPDRPRGETTSGRWRCWSPEANWPICPFVSSSESLPLNPTSTTGTYQPREQN